ncbi:MAG: hypothetical protein L3J67_07845, partial [Hyphomicrobiaceae bacterium]|nr:hypothetical protein [Hyphomicrobiaceae bacterium]
QFSHLTEISREAGLAEVNDLKIYFEQFGTHFPADIEAQRIAMGQRLKNAPLMWRVSDAPESGRQN